MSKHTQGKWSLHRKDNPVWKGYEVREMENDLGAIAFVFADVSEECKANARLIAKAPEMYELLKYLLEELDMVKTFGGAANKDKIRELLKEIDNE